MAGSLRSAAETPALPAAASRTSTTTLSVVGSPVARSSAADVFTLSVAGSSALYGPSRSATPKPNTPATIASASAAASTRLPWVAVNLARAVIAASRSHEYQDEDEDRDGEHERPEDPARRALRAPEVGLGAIARVVALGRLADPVVVVLPCHGSNLPGSVQREAARATRPAIYTRRLGVTKGALWLGVTGLLGS